jgi:hypothetical protein
MLIQTYHHLGDAIDYDEIVRFRKTLEEMVDDVLSRQRTDSPVYAFLKGLTPPSLETSAGEKKAVAIVDQGEKDVKQETKDRTQATLTEQGEQAIRHSRIARSDCGMTGKSPPVRYGEMQSKMRWRGLMQPSC